MKLDEARAIAEDVRLHLSPYCQRIEIAGSVRRLKPDVHDIELVAVPHIEISFNLFGEKIGSRMPLHAKAKSLGDVVKGGDRYIQVALEQGINLDLFIVLPPADWGVIYTIRTGPADFSRWIVTPRSKGGALPDGYMVASGCVWDKRTETPLPLNTEDDFLSFLGLGWINLDERVPRWRTWSGNPNVDAFLWPEVSGDDNE